MISLRCTKQNKDSIEGKEKREKGREGKNREKEWGVVQTLTMLSISGGTQNELPLTRGPHWELGKRVWPNCVTRFSEKSHLWNQCDVHCNSVQKDLSFPAAFSFPQNVSIFRWVRSLHHLSGDTFPFYLCKNITRVQRKAHFVCEHLLLTGHSAMSLECKTGQI